MLELDHVTIAYGETQAVEDFSLHMEPGEIVSLVGESGSGKSSLARAILALEDDVSGRVAFDGQEVLKLDRAGLAAFRRRAQMVFQDPLGSLNPRMKAGAALAAVLRMHGLAPTRAAAAAQAARWLETVGLDAAYAGRFPHELSGGQRQRVNLARALCVVVDNATGKKAEIPEAMRRLMAERDGAVAEV